MPIVDNELVGVRPTDEYPYPTLPSGEYLDELIRNNIEKHGDGLWMVCQFYSTTSWEIGVMGGFRSFLVIIELSQVPRLSPSVDANRRVRDHIEM